MDEKVCGIRIGYTAGETTGVVAQTKQLREIMDFDGFLRQICPLLDLDWRKYRRRAARHRVEGRIKQLGLTDLSSYLEFLHQNPAEAANLDYHIRITISRFFRESSCWTHLVQSVLPDIIEAKSGDTTVRAWSAGCCGGEEPYTAAMIWLEYLQPHFPHHQLQIIATDIDDESLERAREGTYGRSSIKEVPALLVEKYFHHHGATWSITDDVRKLVQFQKRNLMIDPVPLGTDIVFCRYLVFTYYSGHRRMEAIERIWESLVPKGILMIGRKETIRSGYLFTPVDGEIGIYRKRMRSDIGTAR